MKKNYFTSKDIILAKAMSNGDFGRQDSLSSINSTQSGGMTFSPSGAAPRPW